MKKIIKLSILVILLSLLIMSIIIPGNLKAQMPGVWYPGRYGMSAYGWYCYCPYYYYDCWCNWN